MSPGVLEGHTSRPIGNGNHFSSTSATDIPLRCCSTEGTLQTIEHELEKHLGVQSLLSISSKLARQMEECCRNDPRTMLPSFINRFPDGTENGEFLCMEIGGSTLRAAFVRLHDAHGPAQQNTEVVDMWSWPIVEELKASKGPVFMRWIAQTAAPMLKGQVLSPHSEHMSLRTCLTWSFPFEQRAIDRGCILKGGKGYSVFNELVGCDIGTLFRDAFKAEGVLIHLHAIVNDTVSSLLAGNRDEPSMRTSIILGTGINAAAIVPVSKLDPQKFWKYPSGLPQTSSYALVNTELSLLGDTIFPRTLWDSTLIQSIASSSACFQPLEYLCGGYYIGEIVRVILVWAIHSGYLFSGHVPEQLVAPFSFESPLVAVLEGDTTEDLSISAAALSQYLALPCHQVLSLMELRMIKAIAHSVSLRAIGYTAASIYALARFVQQAGGSDCGPKHGQLNRTTIGVSGGVFEGLPGFKTTCEKILNEMAQVATGTVGCAPEQFALKYVTHSGIVGSAIAAAACT